METHVGHLEHEVAAFESQLGENQQLIARLGHENETYYQHNANHREQIDVIRRVLEGYSENLKRTVEEERQALEELKEEIAVGNEEKRQLIVEIQKRREFLDGVEQKILIANQRLDQATEHLAQLLEQSVRNANNPEALQLLVERARDFTISHF